MSASTRRAVGMLLRIGRDRDFEIGAMRLMPATRSAALLVAARMRRIARAGAGERIAAQRHDVAHAGGVIAAHDGVDLLARRGDAGQMRGRRQRRLGQNALDRRMGALAGRAAGAIGDRDELRRQRRQPLDRLPQGLLHLLGRWAGRTRTRRGCGGRCGMKRLARSGGVHHATSRARQRHQRAGVAREPQRHRDLAVGARLRREAACAAPARARRPSSIASPSRAQSRAGDGRTARAGIPAHAARSRPPAAARPGRSTRAASWMARAPSSRKCST